MNDNNYYELLLDDIVVYTDDNSNHSTTGRTFRNETEYKDYLAGMIISSSIDLDNNLISVLSLANQLEKEKAKRDKNNDEINTYTNNKHVESVYNIIQDIYNLNYRTLKILFIYLGFLLRTNIKFFEKILNVDVGRIIHDERKFTSNLKDVIK